MQTVTQDALFASIIDNEFGFDGDVETFSVSGEVTTYEANKFLVQKEDIVVNGQTIQVVTKTRFVRPILSSIALRATQARNRADNDPRIDFNATVVAEREMLFETADGEWVSDTDYVIQAIRRGRPNLKTSDVDLMLILKGYGFEPRGKIPMYLQHLGASVDAFNEVKKHFEFMGGIDNTTQVQGRAKGNKSKVLGSVRHPVGIAIHSMDISKVNRSASKIIDPANPFGTGFIGFADGMWNTFLHILKLEGERNAIKRLDPADEIAYAAGMAREMHLKGVFGDGKTLRAFRNWGGTSRVITTNIVTDEPSETFYAQQVPCGRLSVDNGMGQNGSESYSVWGTRQENSSTEVTDTTGIDLGTELVLPVTGDGTY